MSCTAYGNVRRFRAKATGTFGRIAERTEIHPLPLPPLAEQHRVVAEIEKQLTRLDASVAALRRARANLKRYRASVLKDACEGRLVPTEASLARAEGREYEHAGQLLQRILEERRARWESQEKRRGKYKEPACAHIGTAWSCRRVGCGATMEQCFSVLSRESNSQGNLATNSVSAKASRPVPWVASVL